MIASLWDTAATAPWSFLVGAIVGFALGASFTITRKNGAPRDRD